MSLQDLPASVALNPQSMTNSATATGNTLDSDGYKSAVILVNRGPNVNTNAGSMLVNLEHSDTTDSTNFSTAVAQVSLSKDTANAKAVRFDLDIRESKRYLRVKVTSGTNGTNDNIVVGASALFSTGAQQPRVAAVATTV